MRNLATFLVRFYPRAWRERYQVEMLALLDVSIVTASTCLDLLFGAVRERTRAVFTRTRPEPVSLQREMWRDLVHLVVGVGGVLIGACLFGEAMRFAGFRSDPLFSVFQLIWILAFLRSTIISARRFWISNQAAIAARKIAPEAVHRLGISSIEYWCWVASIVCALSLRWSAHQSFSWNETSNVLLAVILLNSSRISVMKRHDRLMQVLKKRYEAEQRPLPGAEAT